MMRFLRVVTIFHLFFTSLRRSNLLFPDVAHIAIAIRWKDQFSGHFKGFIAKTPIGTKCFGLVLSCPCKSILVSAWIIWLFRLLFLSVFTFPKNVIEVFFYGFSNIIQISKNEKRIFRFIVVWYGTKQQYRLTEML